MKLLKIALYILLLVAANLLGVSCSDDMEDMDPCERISCLNGGTCMDGICDCPDGFTGDRCQIEDRCITQNIICQNGGTCVDGSCDCPEGFNGQYCEQVDQTKIQFLLDNGITPKFLYDAGVPLEELYGKVYQGGLIFYLNTTNGKGLVAPSSFNAYFKWGCRGSEINGADGTAIGTGSQNTMDILSGCSDTDIAAKICDQTVLNGYSDWFLPSKDELNLMYVNLHVNGFGEFAGTGYWSSSESSPSHLAWFQIFTTSGPQYEGPKEFERRVYPARAF